VLPAPGADGAPPDSSAAQAGTNNPQIPAPSAPLDDKVASGGPPPGPNTQIQAANGQGALPQALAPDAKIKRKDTGTEPKDGFREIVETIVFVVVLVLLLKAFLAEAFVIPTGSMATTLLGYHQDVECPQCGHRFKINMSAELDAAAEYRARVTGCTCQNCLFRFTRPGATLLKEGGGEQ
jgi:signal peptidase I